MSEGDRSYDWRVTKQAGGHVTLDIGDELSELTENVGTTAVTRAIGEGLVKIGTRLLTSTVEGDEDEEDW